jgi:hypothetical protein
MAYGYKIWNEESVRCSYIPFVNRLVAYFLFDFYLSYVVVVTAKMQQFLLALFSICHIFFMSLYTLMFCYRDTHSIVKLVTVGNRETNLVAFVAVKANSMEPT